MRFSFILSRLAILVALLAGASAHAQAPAQPETIPPAEFGKVFPAAQFKNLNPGSGAEIINLASTLSKKPIILFYWIAGNPRADEVFQEIQALNDELGGAVTLYGVVYPQPNRGADVIVQRARELGITVPLLVDEGFRVGQQVRVQTVPNITILDNTGRLRLTNGASLHQVLEYKLNLEQAIRRVAKNGQLGNYGYLARYYPVNELIGQECPDFKAPLISTLVEQRMHSLLKGGAINVLIFWSVDCPHCQKSLPELNAWLKDNSQGVNVVSAAKVTNDATRVKTREFCELNRFVFPTLIDKDLQISKLYKVTATPTILIIGPDGVIDSVLSPNVHDLGRAIGDKKRQLLQASSS